MSDFYEQPIITNDSFVIVKTGTVAQPHSVNTETTTTTIAHGLGYSPIITCMLANPDNGLNTPIPVASYVGTNGLVYQNLTCNADETYVYITNYTPSISGTNFFYTPAYTIYYRYYLLKYTGLN